MDLQTYKTRLSRAKQTAVPASIIKSLGLEPGNSLIWNLEPDTKTIKITAISTKLGDYLSGLGKSVWKGVDVEKYIKEGRKDRVLK